MREIVFRGKRVEDGKWLYGYYSDEKAEDTDFPCIVPLEPVPDYDWEVDPETVGQYTGLTDKNGKKIFEHDILKAYDPLDKRYFIGVVKYFDASFYICDTKSVPCYFGEYCFTDFEVEVIGNVYDDVNLLEA